MFFFFDVLLHQLGNHFVLGNQLGFKLIDFPLLMRFRVFASLARRMSVSTS